MLLLSFLYIKLLEREQFFWRLKEKLNYHGIFANKKKKRKKDL